MKTALVTIMALILAAFVLAAGQTQKKPVAPSDVKIRQRMSMGTTAGAETTLYIKGARMRNEMGGGLGLSTVVQCDLKRTLTINEKAKTYFVTSTDTSMPAAEGDGGGAPAPSASQSQTQPRGGVVNVTNTITDTGERKEMFGFTARHIKTSIVKQASPDACDKDQKIETDGWYIDFQYAFECPGQTTKYQPVPVRPQPGCKDEIRTKTIGSAKLGFPVLLTTTVYLPDGRTTSTTQEVLEISREPLDAALFEPPQGYRLVNNMQELYGIAESTYSPSNNPAASSSSTTSPSASTTAETASAATPKKPGVIRIGLIAPTVTMNAGDPAQAAEALRNGFANYIKGPNLEVVLISARVPDLAMQEARQSQCDYILTSSMIVKKGGGSMFGRAIGNIAGSAAGNIPVGSSAGTAAARSATIAGVYTAATIASSIKAKDEVTLAYKLEPLSDSQRSVSNSDKAKASQDGQDVVTGLIERASAVIVAAITRQ
ncbi:MAG TPA: hypothetical protein VEV42_14465 [Pyrinomonadaceae bacterium]|nr:hypothetical protein [Pyrinomonadaceae bacterium]